MSNILSKIKYIINKPNIDFGAFDRPRDTDYEIVGDTADILSKIPVARNKFSGIMYNQPDVSPVSCTVHGAATALSALTGITFTVAQRKEIWNQMKADGTGSEAWGGHVESAVNKWVKFWNTSFPDNKIEYARVTMGSTQMYELLRKGYVIDYSYRWIGGYNEDWLWDRVVDQQYDNDAELDEYGALADGGHCVALIDSPEYGLNIKDRFYDLLTIDNYNTTPSRIKNNIYAVDRTVVPRLVDNNRRVWNQDGYVFYFVKDFEEANVEVDRKLIQRLSKAQPDSGRFVNLQGTNRYGIVQFGKFTELKGRDLSEGFALRNGSLNESLVLPLNKEKWISIGGKK